MAEEDTIETEIVEAEELHEVEGLAAPDSLSLGDVMKVRLTVAADLGRAPMKVRDVIDLKVGSIVTLNKMAGELTDVYVNGLPLAKGEVVVLNDTLHVRVSEILDPMETGEREL